MNITVFWGVTACIEEEGREAGGKQSFVGELLPDYTALYPRK
jgi:hypothetical protein